MKRRHPINKKKQREQGLQKVDFTIDHIDALGQGVSKQDNKITFIAKTLPGEQGSARIHKRSKGVQFAVVETLDVEAEFRIASECEHFSSCPGCHYLHTDYQHELAYKTAALEKTLRPLASQAKFDADTIQVAAAPERLHYRNRVQLHYRYNYIGMLDASRDEIVEIPNCQILRDELKPAFDELYADTSWQDGKGPRGHCELYLDSSGEVKKNWNADYAEGGFSQVNAAMNLELTQQVAAMMVSSTTKKQGLRLLDLFSGAGNLSDALMQPNAQPAIAQRVMVDHKPWQADQLLDAHSDFLAIDLFDDAAFGQFKHQLKQRDLKTEAGEESIPLTVSSFDIMLVDPPRKGFAQLNAWVNGCKPKTLIYVSCNAATMARDLQSLDKKFTIKEVQLMDLFPSTYHFETAACLTF